MRLPLCEKWERNPAQGALHGRREEPEGFKRGIYKRKQDQVRKGLFLRVGSAVTSRVRAFVESSDSRRLKSALRGGPRVRAAAHVRQLFLAL